MKARLSLVTISGLLTIVVCLSLTLIAYAYYPTSFTPGDKWLSDLGNRILKPQGAVYYRTAAVLTGVLLGVFFIAVGTAVWFVGWAFLHVPGAQPGFRSVVESQH